MDNIDTIYQVFMGKEIWQHVDTESGIITYYIMHYGHKIVKALPQLRSHIALIVSRERGFAGKGSR